MKTRYGASPELARDQIQAVSRVTFARALHLDRFEPKPRRFSAE